jgi:hypothetical protein
LKKLLTLNAAVFVLLALHMCPIASGQEKGPDGEKPAWVTLKPGLKVFRLWESIGPDWPQVAVLRLSGAEYKEFAKDPRQYINYNHIFTKDVNKVIGYSQLKEPLIECEPIGDEWLVGIEHDCGSYAAVTAARRYQPKH